MRFAVFVPRNKGVTNTLAGEGVELTTEPTPFGRLRSPSVAWSAVAFPLGKGSRARKVELPREEIPYGILRSLLKKFA